MKRLISMLVVTALVLPMSVSGFAVNAQENSPAVIVSQTITDAISNKGSVNSSASDLQQASNETLLLAKDVVRKLSQEVVFSLGLECTLDHMYNTAKWVSPEVMTLEAKEDASLALIELYEEILTEFVKYDIDSYNAFWEKALDSAVEKPAEINDFIRCGQELFSVRETIEALLALDCYYNLLDTTQIQRMIDDFKEFSNVNNTSTLKIYGESNSSSLFEKYRAVYEAEHNTQGSRAGTVGFTLNGITYIDNSTVNTTSGKAVTTFYAQSQLSNAQINAFYSNFYGKAGFTDLTFVSDATSYYNCHAYAWHSTSPGRKWIGNSQTVSGTTYHGVERYIGDDHCTLLGSSDSVARVNDIIVYYVNGKAAHSGVVVGTNPLRIRSKWGQGCVWIHNKTSVPNEYKDNGTVNVKYYRYTRAHTYQDVDYGNDIYHKHQCTICDYYVLERHSWVEYHVNPEKVENNIRYIPEYYCSKCGAFTLNPIDP